MNDELYSLHIIVMFILPMAKQEISMMIDFFVIISFICCNKILIWKFKKYQIKKNYFSLAFYNQI